MKKLLFLLAISMFLSLPYTAFATLLGSGQLYVEWSYPYSGGSPSYYTDYDGKVSTGFGYNTGLEDIFCVSEDEANSTENVDIYSITSDLDTTFGAGFYEKLSRAAWIADNWTTFIGGYNADEVKGEAQKAVWQVMGVMSRDWIGLNGTDVTIFENSSGQSNTQNWYFANCPGLENGSANYQDYLVHAVAPVPEPASMLLLGTGLIGLAGIGRKKLFKKGASKR